MVLRNDFNLYFMSFWKVFKNSESISASFNFTPLKLTFLLYYNVTYGSLCVIQCSWTTSNSRPSSGIYLSSWKGQDSNEDHIINLWNEIFKRKISIVGHSIHDATPWMFTSIVYSHGTAVYMAAMVCSKMLECVQGGESALKHECLCRIQLNDTHTATHWNPT